MQLFPSIRSVPIHDQLTIALMLRGNGNFTKQDPTASQKPPADSNSVLHSIKTGA
jgi:hypothetical protein